MQKKSQDIGVKSKVLWFANTPGLGEEYLTKNLQASGGWVKSLNEVLQHQVDLHIAFYWHQDVEPFQYKNTWYYPIFSGNHQSKMYKYFNNFRHKITNAEDIHKYEYIIQRVQPDVIHIHGTENPFGYILPRMDVPVVVSIQGILAVCYHKYYTHIGKQLMRTSKSFLSSILGYRPFLLGYKTMRKMVKREAHTFTHAKYLIGRTYWDKTIGDLLSGQGTKYYLNNEMLRPAFYVTPPNVQVFGQNKVNIFTTSSNAFYKGFETLCYAISLLQKHTDLDFEWQVAGIQPSSLIVKTVQKKLKSEFPARGLKLLGFLSETELATKLSEADIYVMPSHIENSPNNLCEAMMMGLPCVASSVGGTSSMLTDREEGILVPDGDSWAMAGAIIELFQQPEKARQYGQKARKTALQRHATDSIVNDLMCIYQDIITLNQ